MRYCLSTLLLYIKANLLKASIFSTIPLSMLGYRLPKIAFPCGKARLSYIIVLSQAGKRISLFVDVLQILHLKLQEQVYLVESTSCLGKQIFTLGYRLLKSAFVITKRIFNVYLRNLALVITKASFNTHIQFDNYLYKTDFVIKSGFTTLIS